MVLLTNAVNANDSNSARLLTSTHISDLSDVELTGIKAIVQDHIVDDNGVSTITLPNSTDLSGTLSNSDFDIKSHNLINQDTFGSQVHVFQSTYRQNNELSTNQSVYIGPYTDSSMTIEDTTFPLIGGDVVIEVVSTTGSDGSYNLTTVSGETNVETSYNIVFTGTDSKNIIQKIALSSDSNTVENSTLLQTQQNSGNSNMLVTNDDLSGVYTLEISSNVLLSSVEANNTFGTYEIEAFTVAPTLTYDSNVASFLDTSSNEPDTTFSNIYDSEMNVANYFLPSSLLTNENVDSSGTGVKEFAYQITLDVSSVGDISVAANDISLAVVDTIASDLIHNTSFMGVLANNNTNKTAVDVSSITYSITNAVVGFNTDLSQGVVDVCNTNFSVSLHTSQEERLSGDVSGQVMFVKDETDARAVLASGDTNVFTAMNIYFPGEDLADLSGTIETNAMDVKDVSYNISIVLPDASNSNYDICSNVLINGYANDSSNSVVVFKDASSTLFDASNISMSDISVNSILKNNNSVMAIIKMTYEELFADERRRVDILDNSDNYTSSSLFTNDQFRIMVTGRNFSIESMDDASYDRIQLYMVGKSLNDLSENSLDISSSAYEITNNANNATIDTPLVLSQTVDSLLDAGYAELFDDDLHESTDTLSMTFKYVPTIVGKRFGSYILQEISSEDPNVTTYKKLMFPQANDLSVNTITVSNETVDVIGLTNSSYSVTKHTTTTSKDVTIDFEYGVYNDLKIKLKNVMEEDVEYKLYDGEYRLPETLLSGATVSGETFDLYDYVRSKTITYNDVSYIQPATGSVSDGDANLTFTLNQTLLTSMKCHIQGVTDLSNGDISLNSSEPFTSLDVFYNTRATITGFGSDLDTTFDVYASVDGDVTLNNEDGYKVKLESQAIMSLDAKHYTTEEIANNLILDTPQDLFSFFDIAGVGSSQNLPDISFDIVIDPSNADPPENRLGLGNLDASNTIVYYADGDVFGKATAIEKEIKGNLMFLITQGSVFTASKTIDGTATSLGNFFIQKDASNSILDSGVVASLDISNATFDEPDGVWELLTADVKVQFDISAAGFDISAAGFDVSAGYDVSAGFDFAERLSDTLTISDISHQDVTFSSYRGITENQTYYINRTPGTVSFSLNMDASSSTSEHEMFIDSDMVLNFANGDSATNVGNTGITVTASNRSRFSDVSFADVSNGNLEITPAQYTIVEQLRRLNGDLIDLSGELGLNNYTPTSFNYPLVDFYDRQVSASETNDVSGGIFVASKIAMDLSENFLIKSSEVITNITDPTGTSHVINFDFLEGDVKVDLSNTPITVDRLTRFVMTSSFELFTPKQDVTYRTVYDDSGNFLGPLIETSSNIVTETYPITSSGVIDLSNADISLNISLYDTLKEYETVDANVYNIDMADHANSISSAEIQYANTSISNESIISTTTSIYDLLNNHDGSYRFTHTQNPKNKNGGNVITNFDIDLNATTNIFVNLPHAFVTAGTYTLTLPEFNNITTSIIGAHYVLDSSSNPTIQLRKYSAPVNAPLENFTINKDGFQAVSFKIDKVEQATLNIPAPDLSDSTPFNFQTSISDLASSLTTSDISFVEISFNDIANEDFIHDEASQILDYVLVGMDNYGLGNILEMVSPNESVPIKSLLIETPDVSRILSGDGAPIFRLRANGHIDAPKISTSNTTDAATTTLKEFVAYNALITK